MGFKEFFHLSDQSEATVNSESEHTHEDQIERFETLEQAVLAVHQKRETGSILPIVEAKILAPFLEQALINKDFLTLRQISNEWEFEQDNFNKTLLQAIANIGIEKGTEILHTEAFQTFAKQQDIQTEMLEIFSGLLHDSKRAA